MPGNERTPLTDTSTKEDDTFSSRAGVIASCLGCSIGPDNIWRFPRILAICAGKRGAFCFLLLWTLFLWTWSIPVLIIEYTLGRFTGQGPVTSFQRLTGNSTTWCGLWITLVNFLIGCWYTVLMGWCMFYAFRIVCFPLPSTIDESRNIFSDFTESTWPVLTLGLSCILIGLLLTKGAHAIEKANLVIVPVQLLLTLAVLIWSLTREGAMTGLAFMFTPDWETLLDPKIWIQAASQDSFDCGAGWGKFIVYAALMDKKEPAVKYAIFIPIFNNIVSLASGIMTFATVFASVPSTGNSSNILDILRSSGPASTGITFIWLPLMFSAAATVGHLFASFFFVCLFLSAVSSIMATVENVVHTFVNYGMNRIYAVVLVLTCTFVVGLLSALDIDYLTSQDFAWAFALLISGIFLQTMVLNYGVTRYRDHVINDAGPHDWKVPKIWEWVVRWMIPIQAIVLLLWWIIHTIFQGPQPWYGFGKLNILPVLLQWLACLLGVILANALLLRTKPAWFMRFSPEGDTDTMLTETGTDDVRVSEPREGYEEVDGADDIYTPNVTDKPDHIKDFERETSINNPD